MYVLVEHCTLRYPLLGGHEHSVFLVRVKGTDVIIGIDNGFLGGVDHVFDPEKVISDSSLPRETREALQEFRQRWRKAMR